MNQKEFLELEKEVKTEKRAKEKAKVQQALNDLGNEEDVLLRATKMKKRYRQIYCGYRLHREDILLNVLMCFIGGIVIYYQFSFLLQGWKHKVLVLIVWIVAIIFVSVLSFLGVAPDLTNEGIYDRLVTIQEQKKEIRERLEKLHLEEQI